MGPYGTNCTQVQYFITMTSHTGTGVTCSKKSRWLKNNAMTHQTTIRKAGLTASNVIACSRGCRWLKNFAMTHQKTIKNFGLTARNVIKHTSTTKILVSDHRRAAVLPRSAKWRFWLLPKLPRGAIKIKIYPEVQFARLNFSSSIPSFDQKGPILVLPKWTIDCSMAALKL